MTERPCLGPHNKDNDLGWRLRANPPEMGRERGPEAVEQAEVQG